MKSINLIAVVLLMGSFSFAQEKGTFTDSRDGKKYKTVKIGKQTWMAENLNYEMEESFCYEEKPEKCREYGRLYSLKAALESCPDGWRLPIVEDYLVLMGKAVKMSRVSLVKSYPSICPVMDSWQHIYPKHFGYRTTDYECELFPNFGSLGFNLKQHSGYYMAGQWDGGDIEYSSSAQFWTNSQIGDYIEVLRLTREGNLKFYGIKPEALAKNIYLNSVRCIMVTPLEKKRGKINYDGEDMAETLTPNCDGNCNKERQEKDKMELERARAGGIPVY